MKKTLKLSLLLLSLFFIKASILGQSLTHPHIWVKDNEKSVILDKIANYSWANNLFNKYKSRVDAHK